MSDQERQRLAREINWITFQPAIRHRLHLLRGHGNMPAHDACAPCDQDADQLARAADAAFIAALARDEQP